MKNIVSAVIFVGLMAGCAAGNANEQVSAQPLQTMAPELGVNESVGKLHPITPGVFAGGQPTEAELEFLARNGVKHVINLRPLNEQTFDEQSVVEDSGMQYHTIAIASADDITIANAKALHDLLAQIGSESVVVHCASGNRVGALMAISSVEFDGATVEDAIAVGKAWGLTRLEGRVREVVE